MTVLRRLGNPGGFGLALLLFLLLPFVSVSCEAPFEGSFSVDYTGVDVITNGEPSVTATGSFADPREREPADLHAVPELAAEATADGQARTGAQVLAIITIVLAAAGVATALLSTLRARRFAAAGCAVAAAGTLIATLVVARSNLASQVIAEADSDSYDETYGRLPLVPDSDEAIRSLVNAEPGFWLAVVALLAIAVVNLSMFQYDRSRRAYVPPPLPPPPGYSAGPPGAPATGPPTSV